MNREMLTEGRLGDLIVVGVIVKRLLKPIEKTPAYKLGLIDKKGKQTRRPETKEEKNSFTILDKFIFKIKKLVGHRVANLATFMLLLADLGDVEREYDLLVEDYHDVEKI